MDKQAIPRDANLPDRIEGGVIFLDADGYFPMSVVFLEKGGKYQEYRIIRSKNKKFQLSK